jgi:hypothetical protein
MMKACIVSYDITKINNQSTDQLQAHILHKIDIKNLGAQAGQSHGNLAGLDLDWVYVVVLSPV